MIENCFAEYTFVQREFAQDEVQCAHWNSKHVTIHPSVIYFKHNNSLAHKSVVYVCDKKSLRLRVVNKLAIKVNTTLRGILHVGMLHLGLKAAIFHPWVKWIF